MRPQVWMRESLMSFQAWMREALMSFQAWMREALMSVDGHMCVDAYIIYTIHFLHCNTIRNKSNMIVKCASLMQHASLVIGFGLCLCPRPCPALQLCLPRALPCLCPCKSLPLPSSWACPCRHCLHLLPQGRRTSNASQAACGLSEYREPILHRHP